MDTKLPTDVTITTKDGFVYKPSKKNDAFMEHWTDPASETFGNVYRSGIKAGFSKSYSKQLLNVAPKWLSTYIDRTLFTPDHIIQAVQTMATDPNLNSRSPADTNLKALEMLMKSSGMIDNKQSNTNIIVQPILGGLSQNPAQAKTKIKSTIIEQEELEQELID